MKKGLIAVIVVGVLLMVGYFMFKGMFNQMNGLREQTKSQWANVETAYQRRADLIPNLVKTVKGYADFEQETLTQVIEARANATSINLNAGDINPENMAKFQAAQDKLSGALSRLLVTVERYPDLKANQNFLQLQSQLEGTENRISVERRRYNEVVRTYNTYIQNFPQFILANLRGFEAQAYFKSAEGSETVPDVSFD